MVSLTWRRGAFIAADLQPAERDTLVWRGFTPVDLADRKGSIYTEDPRLALRLRAYADEAAKKAFSNSCLSVTPWPDALAWAVKSGWHAYQEGAARFALERQPGSYLRMCPGTGKTAVAAMIIRALHCSAVFISPPAMVLTTVAELQQWLPAHVKVVSHDYLRVSHPGPMVWVVPDSRIHEADFRTDARRFLEFAGLSLLPAVLFVDEAQRFCNIDSRRSRALFQGLVPAFARTVYLSGTPMPNRPIELYPVLKASAWSTIDYMSELEFGLRYCGARQDDQGRWVLTGASRMEELAQKIVGTFIHRVRKEDVLDLPPRVEEVVFIGEDLPPALAALDQRLLAKHSPTDLVGDAMARGKGRESSSDLPISTYRRELGVLKAPLAVKFIRELLESDDEAVLVFALHKEVVAALAKGLARFRPVVIVGSTPSAERKGLVDEFQTNPLRRVFIGNITAAGVGYTLVKAARIVLVEYSWVPSENRQAIDRAHRIGQEQSVLAQYLAFRNSADRKVLDINLRKINVTRHI